MNKQGKIWGNTSPVIITPTFEVHRIEVKTGCYCSKHYHQFKCNKFYVESGCLKIYNEKKDYKLVDETILFPKDACVVPAGEIHWFEALQDTVAYEIYYFEPINQNDIIRESVGGTIKDKKKC